jgi:hypothetical protein
LAVLVTARTGRVNRLAAVAVNAKPPTTSRRVRPPSEKDRLEERSFAGMVVPKKEKSEAFGGRILLSSKSAP